jgi:hypothetical protein
METCRSLRDFTRLYLPIMEHWIVIVNAMQFAS